ncbi:MAG: TRAP transporter substrate-binding protein [Deltaproteobacteria bacterium]|nr:TRAP transporter substrate-binding protein [Deltaproteobacteria bacterium]
MKKIVMVGFFVCLVLSLSLLVVQAQAAGDYVFKYSNSQSDQHPRSMSMFFFKDLVEKASSGRIKVELYTSGVLGKEAEVLDMVKTGSLQGCRGGLFERANMMYLLYTLPFFFDNTDQVLNLMRGEFGQKVNDDARKNGFYIPACGVAGGFRNITNNVRSITKPEDLKGLKMRTPPIDMTIKTFQTLGANPQMVAYTETYMALKSNVVDGQENPFSNTVDMKFYEVQKYLSVVNWQIHPDPFYVNPDWYNKLPGDLKNIFDASAKAALIFSDTIWLNSENNYLNFLQTKLKTNMLSPEDTAKFAEAAKPVWQKYVDDGSFSWDDINKAQKMAKGK